MEPNLGHNLSVGRGRMGLLWIKPLALTGDWLLQSRTKLHTISWITHDDWSRPIWGKANGVTAYLCACARKTGSTLQPSPNTPPPVWNTCLVRQFPYPSQPSFWIYIAGITPLKWHDITLNIRIYYTWTLSIIIISINASGLFYKIHSYLRLCFAINGYFHTLWSDEEVVVRKTPTTCSHSVHFDYVCLLIGQWQH